MENQRLRQIIGIIMVVIGLTQATLGSLNGNPIFAFLGIAYALIGVVYLWYERDAFRR